MPMGGGQMRHFSTHSEEKACASNQLLLEEINRFPYEIEAYCEADREYLSDSHSKRSRCYYTHHEYIDEMVAIMDCLYQEPDAEELAAYWHGKEGVL